MHQCLQIREVIYNVFEHIGYDSRRGRKTLARLARTCKIFRDPALDTLWYSQWTLYPLFKCFPESLVKQTITDQRGPKRKKTLSFRRRPTINDYERVLFYSYRIKRLGDSPFSIPTEGKFGILVFPTILSQRPLVGPLLPKLRFLTIGFEDFAGQSAYARLVIGPSLLSIKIDDCDLRRSPSEKEHLWDNAAAALERDAPNLTHFNFDTFREWTYRYPSMNSIDSICYSFRNIKQLMAKNLTLTRDALNHLATLPELSALEFGIPSKELQAFVDTTPDPGNFNEIVSLAIYTDAIAACNAFISRLTLHHLRDLTIAQYAAGVQWEIGTFFSTVSLRIPGLQSLSLWNFVDKDSEVELEPIPFTRSTLSPLLRLSHLRCLDITFDLSLHIDDHDIKDISIAWPLLEKLSLPDHELETTPHITFYGLLTLTEKCKNLDELVIRMDASHIPSFSLVGDVEPSNLSYLNVCTSPLSEHLKLLEIFPLIFSNLSSLDFSDIYKFTSGWALSHPHDISSDAWKNVVEGLKPLVPSDDVTFRPPGGWY